MAQANFHVCYHCKDRTIGCHSKCAAYQKEKAESEKQRIARNEQCEINSTLYSNAKHRMSTSTRKR